MAEQVQDVDGRRVARWTRAGAVVLGTGMAVTLSACGISGTADFTPKPVVTVTATPSAPPPTSASAPATSATPSEPPTSDGVDATGSMAIFMTVSDKLTGTCQTLEGQPTIVLSEQDNEWYKTVDLTIVLDTARTAVVTVDGAFGQDSEGFTWELGYDSANPAKGTSGKLVVDGKKLTASGKLTARETRKGNTRTEVLPFRIVTTCAGTDW